ncbi:adenylate kinase family protein [Natronomonas gomsonensis]|uniref:adenylate kinase family protein n=1 Tax=Natronomonas gomsonensis TaxID=1046043 RepID=UPI0020CA31EF|nr:adenylate kinase family protein [Natronomonas gomsonensis]MCY4729147.1 adenylate kinase family protein [Natronomonas gomsonensis]
MRVAVTGTPGTGKTTATDLLDADLDVVHLNDLIREEGLATGEDPERGSLVADIDALRERLADREDVLVESHLAHHLDADRVVVLRCHPEVLHERLSERGESAEKARENADAEALDVILSEAVDAHGLDSVYEIDTTDRTPEEVAADIEAVVAGERAPSAGDVEFIDYL